MPLPPTSATVTVLDWGRTTYADALNNRAVALIRQRRYQAAIEDLTRAITLRPGYADAYFNRAVAYERLGRVEDAERDYTAEKNARGQAR
jgi:Flp pilus assembly protein TadD